MISILNRKLYQVWYNMNDRCYNEKHQRYALYGAKGVSVCKDWKDFKTFKSTIISVEGYDEQSILNGLVHLDKDSKDIENKIYSPDTCCFISKEVNNKYKPNQMKEFIGISPEGIEYEGLNQSDFAREHDLNQGAISGCLRGVLKTHKKWKFNYK